MYEKYTYKDTIYILRSIIIISYFNFNQLLNYDESYYIILYRVYFDLLGAVGLTFMLKIISSNQEEYFL